MGRPPLALRAALTWEHPVESEDRDFGWFAARAFHVIDWIPQRVSGFIFAVAGNFEDPAEVNREVQERVPR